MERHRERKNQHFPRASSGLQLMDVDAPMFDLRLGLVAFEDAQPAQKSARRFARSCREHALGGLLGFIRVARPEQERAKRREAAAVGRAEREIGRNEDALTLQAARRTREHERFAKKCDCFK